MRILALTINKIHYESGICRIFSPLLFHHQGLYLGANPSYIKPLPTQAMLLPKPSPLQILLPQEPAQQEGGSQYFTLCKQDLGQMQGTMHKQKSSLFWHNLVYTV